MPATAPDAAKTWPVFLLCPNCKKRLPLSGTLSMRGSTGVFCRNCHSTVRVSMDIEDARRSGDESQER
jgi:hypothetical protein